MATLVFAVFDDADASRDAISDLSCNTPEHPAFGVQVHARAPLDGNDLPESATEIGRNTVIGTAVGGGLGLALGLGLASGFHIMGLTPMIGAMFGLFTGLLSGVLRGVMAGTRQPKAALREVAEGLEAGAVLLTIEVDDGRHVELVEDILERRGASEIDRC